MTDAVATRKAEVLPVRLDPQMLLMKAVEGNAGIETLERLVALAEKVKAEQARSAWFEAMSEFQRRCPEITKSAKADIATAKGYYSYKYAKLDEIMASIRPLLGALGLSVFWTSPTECPPGRVVVSCRVAHVLGHVEESGQVSLPVPDASERGGGNPLQRIGSALSYARRYSLMSIMGISPEDDDDAQSAGAKTAPPVTKTSPPPQTAMPPRTAGAGQHFDNALIPEDSTPPKPPSEIEQAWAAVTELQETLGWTNTQLRDHCASEYKVQKRVEMNLDQVRSLEAYMRQVVEKREKR